MDIKSTSGERELMGDSGRICFHEDRLLGWFAFSYCLLLLVIHFVRLITNVPLSVPPGLSEHPVALTFLLILGILLSKTKCAEERLLFLSVAVAYLVVVILALVPNLQLALGIWGRVLMVMLWGSATGFCIRILTQHRAK